MTRTEPVSVPAPRGPDPALAIAVRRLREDKGTTLETLAHDSGVTNGSLSAVERAKSSPRWATVRGVARGLGVSLVTLSAAVEAAEVECADDDAR